MVSNNNNRYICAVIDNYNSITFCQRDMIHVENLTFSYSKKKTVFNGLNLDIPTGGIAGILGPNGAGKTTLLKLLTGLMFPKAGTINVMGDTPGDRLPRFLEELYFVPDELMIPGISGKRFAELYNPFYPRFDSAQFDRLLTDFEVQPGDKLNKMSLGQKKKFMVAFALATNCRLLVFDEPTNGMDLDAKKYFKKAITSMTTEEQLVLISTHQVADINTVIDRVVILDEGNIMLNKTIWNISQEYAFVTTAAKPNGAIYAEEAPGGFRAVVPASGEQTEIDLELLFFARKNLKQ